jgi:hypothetical protein
MEYTPHHSHVDRFLLMPMFHPITTPNPISRGFPVPIKDVMDMLLFMHTLEKKAT